MGRRSERSSEDIERNRRIAKTFSIPTYIAEELSNCKNPSGLVTMFLEENAQRIGDLTIEDAIKSREVAIKETIRKASEEVMEKYFKKRFEKIVLNTLAEYGYKVKTEEDIQ